MHSVHSGQAYLFGHGEAYVLLVPGAHCGFSWGSQNQIRLGIWVDAKTEQRNFEARQELVPGLFWP